MSAQCIHVNILKCCKGYICTGEVDVANKYNFRIINTSRFVGSNDTSSLYISLLTRLILHYSSLPSKKNVFNAQNKFQMYDMP